MVDLYDILNKLVDLSERIKDKGKDIKIGDSDARELNHLVSSIPAAISFDELLEYHKENCVPLLKHFEDANRDIKIFQEKIQKERKDYFKKNSEALKETLLNQIKSKNVSEDVLNLLESAVDDAFKGELRLFPGLKPKEYYIAAAIFSFYKNDRISDIYKKFYPALQEIQEKYSILKDLTFNLEEKDKETFYFCEEIEEQVNEFKALGYLGSIIIWEGREINKDEFKKITENYPWQAEEWNQLKEISKEIYEKLEKDQ